MMMDFLYIFSGNSSLDSIHLRRMMWKLNVLMIIVL